MEDTVADTDAQIAMLMAVCSATADEATWAIGESDGDVDIAMALLFDKATQSQSQGKNAERVYEKEEEEETPDDYALKREHVIRSAIPGELLMILLLSSRK